MNKFMKKKIKSISKQQKLKKNHIQQNLKNQKSNDSKIKKNII